MEDPKQLLMLMQQLRVPEEVCREIKNRKFETSPALYWAITEKPEAAFESILEGAGIDKGSAPSVMETLEAGLLRRLLAMCKECCEKGDPSSSTALAVLPQHQTQVLGLDLGPKLDSGTLQQLWEEFDKSYPSEQLESESRPCKQLVQQVFTHTASSPHGVGIRNRTTEGEDSMMGTESVLVASTGPTGRSKPPERDRSEGTSPKKGKKRGQPEKPAKSIRDILRGS